MVKDINKDLEKSRGAPFVPGEIVVFETTHYSRHQDASGYSFKVTDANASRARGWIDLYDDEPEPNWAEYFIPVKP